MGTLDNGIIESLEGFIREYGYSKTITYLDELDQYGLSQFVFGLYLNSFYRSYL